MVKWVPKSTEILPGRQQKSVCPGEGGVKWGQQAGRHNNRWFSNIWVTLGKRQEEWVSIDDGAHRPQHQTPDVLMTLLEIKIANIFKSTRDQEVFHLLG